MSVLDLQCYYSRIIDDFDIRNMSIKKGVFHAHSSARNAEWYKISGKDICIVCNTKEEGVSLLEILKERGVQWVTDSGSRFNIDSFFEDYPTLLIFPNDGVTYGDEVSCDYNYLKTCNYVPILYSDFIDNLGVDSDFIMI